jgi:hypothetical protein
MCREFLVVKEVKVVVNALSHSDLLDAESTMEILECACMVTIECFAENDPKKRKMRQ